MENRDIALPDFRHLFKTVDERGLSRILELALDRQLIVKLCHICGLVHDGHDLESKAVHALAAQLAEDCFEREVTATQVFKTLAHTSAKEIEQIRQTSPEHLNGLLVERTDAFTRECGRLAVAMLLDEREAVHASAIELLNRTQAYPTWSGVSEEMTAPYLQDDPALNGEGTDSRQVENLDLALIEARRKGADLDSRNRVLEDRVREMQRRIERFQEEAGATSSVAAEKVGTAIRDTVERIATRYAEVQRTMEAVRVEVDQLRNLRHDSPPGTYNVPAPAASERVGIFIDVQNMWYAARQHYGISARLDFDKLMQAAVGDRRLIRAYAYVIQTPEVDQSGFVTMLEQFSYQVKRKDLRRRSDGSAKGDWDMEMAIDMIRMADKVDVVILASGDGDFVSLIQLLKELGPRVEVFSFPHNTARDLVEASDRYQPIDESLLISMDPGR